MAYEVGTAVLHVVLGFGDIERKLDLLARQIAKDLGKSIGDQVGDGAEKGFEKAAKAGESVQRKTAERAQAAAEKAAQQQARVAQRAAEKQARDAQRAAEKEVRDAAKVAARVAEVKAREARLAAEKQARDEERATASAAREAEREAARKARDEERSAAVLDRQRQAALRVREQQARDAARVVAEQNRDLDRAAAASLDRQRREARTAAQQAAREAQRVATEQRRYLERTAAASLAKQRQEALRVAAQTKKDAELAAAQAESAFGKTWAGKVRKALGEAYQKLPDIEIDADSSPAQRRIAELRAELRGLSEAKVGVDMDAGAAFARIKEIKAELVRLAHDSPTIDVQVDSLAAAVQLAAIEKASARLDGKNIRMQVDAAGVESVGNAAGVALSRLEGMIAGGISLGTIIVPAAAAASTAIGFIGTAAVSSLAGVGALVLGFSGIAEAVKAMQKYSEDAVKSQVSLSRAQGSVLTATDAVRSSERALANTRASSAESARRSAQAVEDAERGVARAQEDARRASLDLVRAREDERRANQDLKFDLEGLSIAQRQAALDQIDAKRELDKLLTNKRATREQREQAQITYDEITLRIKEQTVQQKRLTDEQAHSAKVGVDGSDRVQAAQRRVRDTTEGIADAQRRYAEAQRAQQAQARQSAFAVASAQQAVVSANRQLEQSYERAKVAGGDALDNLNDSLKDLSPRTREFARYIFNLKDEFLGLRAAASDNLLPGVQTAIDSVLPHLPKVRDFIARTAEAVGGLFVSTSQLLTTNPTWRRFWDFVSRTTVPTMERLYRIAANVATGLVGLLLAFEPFNEDFGGGLERFTERFAKWSASLQHNAGFQQFLRYARDNAPAVVDLIGQLTTFVARFVVAAAPIGTFVVDALDALVRIINAIPIWVLRALLFALAAYSAALLAMNAATRIAAVNQGLLNRVTGAGHSVMDKLRGITSTYSDAAGNAADRTGRFSGLLAGVKGVAGVARAGLSGLVSFLGGPWGIAIGAGILAVSYFTQKAAEQKQKVDNLAAALGLLGEAYKKTRSVSGAAVRDIVAQSKELQGLVNNANKYGVSVDLIARAAAGEKAAQESVIASLRSKQRVLSDLVIAQNAAGAEGGAQASQYNDEIKMIDSLVLALRSRFTETNNATAAQNALDEAQRRANGSTPPVTEAEQALANAVKVLSDNTATAADKVNALKNAQDALTGAAKSQIEAEEAYESAVDQTYGALSRKNNSLDASTAAGRANREMLENLLTASTDMYYADVAANVPIAEATRRHEARIAALKKEAGESRVNKTALDELVNSYGKVPPNVETLISMSGDADVDAVLKKLAIQQKSLQKGISLAESKRLYEKEERLDKLDKKATGGSIVGPGTGTSDDVLLWGSDGEFMQPTAAVDYYGKPFMEALRRRVIPKEILPGFAQGGLVQWPFPVNVANTYIPTRDEVIAAALGGQPSAGGIGSADQMKILRAKFPGLALLSGWRPGSRTASGSVSYHAMIAEDGDKGRAVDVPPMRTVFDYIHDHFMAATRELIWAGDPSRNIWNGRHHRYSASLLSQHGVAGQPNAHIHWAYDSGGMLPEGTSSVVNATGKPEPVLTPGQWETMYTLARGAQSGPATENHFHFRDTTLDPGRLRAIEERQNALARVGRPG